MKKQAPRLSQGTGLSLTLMVVPSARSGTAMDFFVSRRGGLNACGILYLTGIVRSVPGRRSALGFRHTVKCLTETLATADARQTCCPYNAKVGVGCDETLSEL